MTTPRWIAVVLCLGMLAPMASAEDWPQFRGPTGQGHSSEKNLPTEFGPSKNVAWKVDIPGGAWSSPIVHKGRVYLTTAVEPPGGEGRDRSLRVMCLNAKNGKAVWDIEVFQQKDQDVERIHRKNSHASPTPITDGKHLFVHFGPQGTACLTLDGKVVWKRIVSYSPRHGNGCSPILVGDLVVFSCDGSRSPFLIALNKSNGKVAWKKARPPVTDAKTFSFATPLAIEVGGKTQIVSPATGQVVSYEAKSGREVWRVQYSGFSVIPRPVYAHGLVFLSTSYMRPKVLAVDPTGKGNVTGTHLKWSIARGAPNTPSTVVVGKELYFVSDRGGIVSCVDAKSGDVHWQKRIGGNYSASPVYADGKIYFQSEEGNATVIAPGKTFKVLAKNSMEERTLASYAVADGALFIRTATKLYRIQKK